MNDLKTSCRGGGGCGGRAFEITSLKIPKLYDPPTMPAPALAKSVYCMFWSADLVLTIRVSDDIQE